MNITDQPTRPYLLSYSLTDELQDFFKAIDSVAQNYWLVSATERRCLNLVSRFLPRLNNLVSNSGLLLQYRKLADFYEENGYFPPILIIDDIMVHGRGIAKLLQQLENLLYDELVRRGYLSKVEDRNDFRRMFSRAVDIYIYAKNTEEILLEDRFLLKITSWKDLESRELHDLSQQLSDSLTRWEVANTSFVVSIRNKALSDYLLNKHKEDVARNGYSASVKMKPWMYVPWKYCNEEMLLYIRLHGNNDVNRISTVRFFPQREHKAPPQLTSFTLLGDMSADTISNFCLAIQSVLTKDLFPEVCSILSEANTPILQQSKGQLISFIWSVLDLFDFISTAIPEQISEQILSDLRSDIGKIACNFGSKAALQPELSSMMRSPIREKLENVMYPIVNSDVSKIGNLQLGDNIYTTAENARYEEYNQIVECIFYQIGIEAEWHAYFHSNKRYLFQPKLYQYYDSNVSKIRSDGIISFSDFIGRAKEKCKSPSCLYQCLAAYIALMDNGIMGVRLFYQQSDNKLITLSKAGEMATFYYPKRFSMFIPAFSRIERRSYRLGLSAWDAISKFYEDCLAQRNSDFGAYLKAFPFDEQTKFFKKMPTMKELQEAISYLHSCGQNFREWDFENLTYQESDLARTYQWLLEKKAMAFLGLPIREF